ncbi:MAG: hypothetical protein U0703_14895 [Anaerolineae bacterium]
MFGLKLERAPAPLWMRGVIPLVAIALTFVLVSVLVIAAGADPVAAFFELLINPLTKNSARLDILVLATPIILTGVAVSLAFACGYYNIGAEGQLYAGAIAAGWIGTMVEGAPPLVAIPLMLVGGFLAGALWALLPALLKVRLRVDEVVTTLLLNSVMLFIVSALLNASLARPADRLAPVADDCRSGAVPADHPALTRASRLPGGAGGRRAGVVAADAHALRAGAARRRQESGRGAVPRHPRGTDDAAHRADQRRDRRTGGRRRSRGHPVPRDRLAFAGLTATPGSSSPRSAR